MYSETTESTNMRVILHNLHRNVRHLSNIANSVGIRLLHSVKLYTVKKTHLNRKSTGPDKMFGLERILVYRGFSYLPIHRWLIDTPTIVYIQQLFLFTSRGHKVYVVCFVCNLWILLCFLCYVCSTIALK